MQPLHTFLPQNPTRKKFLMPKNINYFKQTLKKNHTNRGCQMTECPSDKCPIQTNLNKGKFKLKCSNCKHELPLTYQREHGIVCPQCKNGILYWTPDKPKGETHA